LGEQNLPGQQVGHPSLVKRGAERKLLPFSKGGVPPRVGRRDQGISSQKIPFPAAPIGRTKIEENLEKMIFFM
jgi:hypothetical protein